MLVFQGDGFAFIATRLRLLDLDAGWAAGDGSPCDFLSVLFGKARYGGKLDDLAAHDCTAFPAPIKASIAAAMVALSW